MTEFREQLVELLQDLVTLEVTTIVVEEIEVTRAPDWRNAIEDLHGRAQAELNALGAGPPLPPAAATRTRGGPPPGGGAPEAAAGVTAGARAAADPGAQQHAARIQRMLGQLESIARDPLGRGLAPGTRSGPLEGFAPQGATAQGASADSGAMEISLHNRLQLKKLWAHGTARPAAHTLIAIDGDVTTFVDANAFAEGGQQLLELHQLSVGSALAYWKGLAEAAGSLFKGLVGLFKSL